MATSHVPHNHARPPSPGDDASPFLLRVYVTHGVRFRPLQHFDHFNRPVWDEYKLYVWRSTPLKTLAQLLHSANPSISKPLALHSFRLVYYNSSKDAYSSEDMGRGITRVSRSALADRLSSDEAREFLRVPGGGQEAEEDRQEGENGDATRTLADFNLVDGDMVECLILDDEQKRSSQARRSGGAAMPPSNHPAMRPDYQGTWGPPRMGVGRRGIAEQRTGAGGGW